MKSASTIMLCDFMNSSRKTLQEALEAEGHKVDPYDNSQILLTSRNRKNSSIVIFNCHTARDCIPDIKKLIAFSNESPVIILSDFNDPKIRFSALQMGVFEFISGPYLIQEILIHIKRALRFVSNDIKIDQKRDDHFLEFGDFIWSSASRELRTKKGFLINLTETETAIMEIFIHNSERELSRDEIWLLLRKRERWPLDRTLDGHIARLRAKIQDSSNNTNCFIKSVRGKGYIFKPFAFFKAFDESAADKIRSIANEMSF